MRRAVSIVMVVLSTMVAVAQAESPKATLRRWEVTVNGGYMMPNNMSYSDKSSPTMGVDVSHWWRGIDTSAWRVMRHFPTFGIKASYAHIPNSIAGDRFGLTGVLRQPFSDADRWEWSIGFGLSAYTRPRSITGDTNNIFIGSLVNCFIDLGVTCHATERMFFAAHLLHTSNGMLMWPNMGLNYLQVDVGYGLGARSIRGNRPSVQGDYPSRNEFGVAVSPGCVMSRDREFDGYYFCYDLSLYLQHYTSPTFAFGGAVDLWYNFCDMRHIDREEGVYQLPLYVSAMAVMEFFWGPLSVKAGAGPVIVASPQVTTPYYERAGAYYNFGHNYLGVAVNAHGGRVEFIEWTYGRRFPLKR